MSAVATKTKYPRRMALDVAREMIAAIKPACHELVIAGSLRRRNAEVGDVEVLYIPKVVEIADPEDFFGRKIKANAVDLELDKLLAADSICRRPKSNGQTTWGDANKLSVHLASGVPVDFFAASHENWWNLLVCRTGGMESNISIATAAKERGWQWCPYGPGFRSEAPSGKGPEWSTWKVVKSEREVFEFVDLKYKEPWERS